MISKRAMAALATALMAETINPDLALAQANPTAQIQSQNEAEGGNDSKKPKESLLKFSGSGTLFVGSNGGINPVANARLNVRNVLEFNAIGDSGYLADLKTRRNNRELFLETHSYPLPNLPVRPAFETYNWTNKPDFTRAGLGTHAKIGKTAELAADYYFATFPYTIQIDRLFGDRELFLSGKVNLGKGFSAYGAFKHIDKKTANDASFVKAGVQYDIGKGNGKNKKNYIRAEYRNWPTAKDGPYQGRRHKGFYVGYGKRF